MNNFIDRFTSPVTWLAIFGLIYTILAYKFDLPEWTQIVGYVTIIFGITNNPTDKDNF